MGKANLLIVEDELIIAYNIRSALVKQGYSVIGTAVNGEDAIKMALELSPDLILMDIVLEGPMDGIEAARRIRQQADIPFIYLTAHADADTIRRTHDATTYGFLNKPFNDRDLYINIDAALYKHKMERRLRENEEKYRTLVENISDTVFSTDENGILMYISPQIKDIIGHTEYDMIGQKFTTMVHAEDRERLIEIFEKKAKGVVNSEEFRLVTKTGTIKWASSSSRPVMTGGAVTGRRGVIADITERKQAESMAIKNERFLDAVFNSIQDGISVLDRDFTIIKVNRTMNTWYSHMLPLEGKTCYKALHGRDEICETCPAKRAFKSGNLESDIIPLIAAEGRTGWLELFSFPMMDETGRVTGVVEYIKDITKRLEIQESLKNSEKKFRLMIEGSPYAIAVLDEADALSYINQTFTDIFGYSMKDLPHDKKWYNRMFPDGAYRKKIINTCEKAKLKTRSIGSSIETRECETMCRDGSVKRIEYRKVRISDSSILFMNDLTDKKKTPGKK